MSTNKKLVYKYCLTIVCHSTCRFDWFITKGGTCLNDYTIKDCYYANNKKALVSLLNMMKKKSTFQYATITRLEDK